MNTSLISHRMFVAALAGEADAAETRPPTAPATRTGNTAPRPAPTQLTIEQVAAMAARYWPDFPFGFVREERMAS